MNCIKEKKYSKIKNLVTKKNISRIAMIAFTLSILIYFGINLFQKISDEKSIDINGLKNLNNLDVESYDVKAISLELKGDEIIVAPISYSPGDDSVANSIFYITSDTNFYKRVINNTVNSDGETFSTLDYEVITRFDLQEIIDSEENGILTYFWTNTNNECSNILISYE
jgi:hypothetical protein